MAHRGSLPEVWGVPPEHGIHFEIDRINMKIDAMQLEIRALTRQMHEMMQNIQRNQSSESVRNLSREIILPTFSGNGLENAEEFLSDLSQYLAIKEIPDFYQSKVIMNALKDQAKIWFNAVRYEIINLEDFRERFREKYMSEEVQDRSKKIWETKKYNEGSLINYYYRRVAEASKFYPVLTQYKINKTILSQFPQEIQLALAGVDLENTQLVVRALGRVEDSQEKLSRSNFQNYREDKRDFVRPRNYDRENNANRYASDKPNYRENFDRNKYNVKNEIKPEREYKDWRNRETSNPPKSYTNNNNARKENKVISTLNANTLENSDVENDEACDQNKGECVHNTPSENFESTRE